MNPFAALRPELLVAVGFALGLVVGSFLNVVIHRMPAGESVVRPRSRCPSCGHTLSAWENVPVISWIALRGRCRGCGAAISWRYPAVELFTGVVFAAVVWRHGAGAMTPVWCVFAAALVAAAVIDFEHRIIPDEISLGGLLVALVAVPLVSAAASGGYGPALTWSLAGALLGGGLLWSVGFAHARISTALGRRFDHWPGEGEELPTPGSVDYWVWFPGLGFGDVKLMAMIGAVLGPVGVVQTIVVAALAGLLGGLLWALVVRDWAAPFGFGPAIAAGALGVVLAPPGWLLAA